MGMDLPVPALPYSVTRPPIHAAPVIFTSPHSGRDYPADFVASARLDAHDLRRSEDSFVDELFAAAPEHGMPLLAATFPRAFCDPNREPWELDPAMFDDTLPAWVNTTSPRVGAGLGTIARVVASGEPIYRHKLNFHEAERRVRLYWEPYHQMLSELIETTRSAFGTCLLIDCHSMPAHGSASRTSGQAADFVLGDAHGTTCSPCAVRLVERLLVGLGYTVRRNDPYSGGYITRHYGQPREGVHALQIEVARPLYMDEARIMPSAGFARLQRDIGTVITALAAQTLPLLGR
jgi:N-formylglutamate deformylase